MHIYQPRFIHLFPPHNMSTIDINLLNSQDQICSVQCGVCSTILLVSVPCNSLSLVATVRCGHCFTILSVNMLKACFLPLHLFSSLNQFQEMEQQKQEVLYGEADADTKQRGPNSLFFEEEEEEEEDDDDEYESLEINQIIHKPPEKKQRAPSAYNQFIKEEIKRLKNEYPNMSHKQAFSTAAKNWAHCPQSVVNEEEVVDGFGAKDRKMTVY
ncbi:axial regulator YABBY 4-like isoform X1 [Primulina tabacum]|uniref:axial regulator YABBY 4-like isoform X1 n=1 Tax=Primulina tabacum TaxID=48773 RepID=UPI003F5A5766